MEDDHGSLALARHGEVDHRAALVGQGEVWQQLAYRWPGRETIRDRRSPGWWELLLLLCHLVRLPLARERPCVRGAGCYELR